MRKTDLPDVISTCAENYLGTLTEHSAWARGPCITRQYAPGRRIAGKFICPERSLDRRDTVLDIDGFTAGKTEPVAIWQRYEAACRAD